MKILNDFKHNIYIINNSNEVEEMTYMDYLNEFWSDDTTSPRGVENRLHIRERVISCDCCEVGDDGYILHEDNCNDGEIVYELWTWGVNGNNPRFIEKFETEEDAEVAILESKEFDYNKGGADVPMPYDTFEEAEQSRLDMNANEMGVDVEVYQSIERKEKIVKAARRERIMAQHRANVAAQQVVFNQYSKLIKKVENERYKETCNRLAAALPERIKGSTFHNIVKSVRSN